MHCINELCYILIISIFNFLIFIHFTSQKTLKPSLAEKLKLIFKFSTIMGQENIPLWTHSGKTCIKCYTIALKLWDEFNANFLLLYFSSYSSRPWHDKWAVARSHVITHANQEKGCLGGWWIAHSRVKMHGLISLPWNSKKLVQNSF